MIIGDNHMTLNRIKANFRGHYVSHERKLRGHLKKSQAKSPFFEGQGKPVKSLVAVDLSLVAVFCHW